MEGCRFPRGLEYQANLVSLQVLDTSVTRIMHQNMPLSEE